MGETIVIGTVGLSKVSTQKRFPDRVIHRRSIVRARVLATPPQLILEFGQELLRNVLAYFRMVHYKSPRRG